MFNSYDKYKLSSPEDSFKNKCLQCGEPCKFRFCSKDCADAWVSE